MKKNDDYIVLLKGVKLSKREANIVGLSIIFGIIGTVVSMAAVGINNKTIGFMIVAVFVLIGYLIGNKIFKK
ncbi:MAG: hypothetical protein WC412_07975 [Candidatus Omnitrophota bacterium]|jgi:hypothetical protein